jgi:hypothetical protein
MTERDDQSGDGETATCHMCGRVFPTQLALSQHLIDDHDDDGLPTPGPIEPESSNPSTT